MREIREFTNYLGQKISVGDIVAYWNESERMMMWVLITGARVEETSVAHGMVEYYQVDGVSLWDEVSGIKRVLLVVDPEFTTVASGKIPWRIEELLRS